MRMDGDPTKVMIGAFKLGDALKVIEATKFHIGGKFIFEMN